MSVTLGLDHHMLTYLMPKCTLFMHLIYCFSRITGNLIRVLSPQRPVQEITRLDIWANDNLQTESRIDTIYFEYKKDPIITGLDRRRTIVRYNNNV